MSSMTLCDRCGRIQHETVFTRIDKFIGSSMSETYRICEKCIASMEMTFFVDELNRGKNLSRAYAVAQNRFNPEPRPAWPREEKDD